MKKFRGFDNGMGKRVLNKLKTTELRFREIEVKWLTISKLGVDNQSRWLWYWLFWNQGEDGYNEVQEYENSRI